MIKAVFFDMYGTLAGFEPSRFDVQTTACADFGITLTPKGILKGYASADEFMVKEFMIKEEHLKIFIIKDKKLWKMFL